MNERTFVYAIHIATTPEKLWEALTSNEFIQKWWGGEWRLETDWKVGSPLKFFTRNGELYSEGEVLEADPPKTLVYTWPEPKSENPALPEHLTWEITPSGPGTVMLKLIHKLSEKFYEGVSQGWPAMLSSLKSLLELGRPLDFHPRA